MIENHKITISELVMKRLLLISSLKLVEVLEEYSRVNSATKSFHFIHATKELNSPYSHIAI